MFNYFPSGWYRLPRPPAHPGHRGPPERPLHARAGGGIQRLRRPLPSARVVHRALLHGEEAKAGEPHSQAGISGDFVSLI